jgi:hypothetical protein
MSRIFVQKDLMPGTSGFVSVPTTNVFPNPPRPSCNRVSSKLSHFLLT